MKKAWVISLMTISAPMFVKHPQMEGLKVLSLVSSRHHETYIKEQLRSLWQFLCMDWHSLQEYFNLDLVKDTFDKRIKSQPDFVYLHEKSFILQAQKSDIKNIEILDSGTCQLTWKPYSYYERERDHTTGSTSHKEIEGEEKTASAISIDMRDFFRP